ncbi:hypothetical protein MKQ68_14465 [Chitinophaga horti]|uniref:Uncharacterized protein n=1 Tax=Chitinophaga horti TaxID=2920382 RepID=A0ABY6IV93_9BACT|nr:hypothetical protein [Chitinophaga horti]UYQ91293.1 hypothetical protein MKQ68_14465 [Chitinophaga horti]
MWPDKSAVFFYMDQAFTNRIFNLQEQGLKLPHSIFSGTNTRKIRFTGRT